MKKASILFAIIFGVNLTYAQKIWFEPDGALMDQEITIYVDLEKLDQTLDHTVALVDAATAGEDMYIWTWSPYEHGAGTPKANGIGSTAWKNSNPVLKMTKEDALGNLVYSYTMVPTEFYEVDAKKVYDDDIKLLVKPQDGGGYGDPDIKSEDLNLGLEAPFVSSIVKGIPSVCFQDDIILIEYDINFETEDAMIGAGPDDIYMYAAAWDTVGEIGSTPDIQIASFFNVKNTPELKMEYKGDGVWRRIITPEDFFGVAGTGTALSRLVFTVVRKDGIATRRTQDDIVFNIQCW